MVDRSPYPAGFPSERSAGYVPESSLLAVEWYLPAIDAVPEQKAFRHVKTRKVVEPVARPLPEIRLIYQSVIAQIALRTLREVFDSSPAAAISTIVFNGRVHAIDLVDIISDLDKRPNLLELTPKEFEEFIQNLFAKMGYDTKLYQASGDGGVDCVAYDPHPITGGKFIIQAKLYNRTVQPTHVRDLWGNVQHEGATKGIMITTSGYGPDSYKFASGKPLNLIDGSGLLSLCQQSDIPARIVNRGKRKDSP